MHEHVLLPKPGDFAQLRSAPVNVLSLGSCVIMYTYLARDAVRHGHVTPSSLARRTANNEHHMALCRGCMFV